MLQNAAQTIEKYNMLKEGDKVVVGVSGGPDSIALLHLLMELSPKYRLSIFAAHINHNLRGDESDCDEEYVKEVCKKFDISLFIKNADVKSFAKDEKLSLEEAGRKIRYNFFNEVLEKVGAQKIAVAHNANDNAETILMRICRGTGLYGLSGIKPVNGNVIRPLIETDRSIIEDYCRDNNLNPRIDSSNLEKDYTRNKVRLELIPYLMKFNPSIIETINRMGSLLGQDEDFFRIYTNKILDEVIISNTREYITIDLSKIKGQPMPVLTRVIRKLAERLQGSMVEIEQANVETAVDFIFNAKTGSMLNMPNGIVLKKKYREIVFTLENKFQENKKYNYYIDIPGKLFVDELGTYIETIVESNADAVVQSKFIGAFDLDKIEGSLEIRNRQDGDVFSPKGMKGTKKLKEFFIDEKIDRENRDKIPLIAVGKEILWVIGYRTSEKYKVDQNTQNVLMIKYKM